MKYWFALGLAFVAFWMLGPAFTDFRMMAPATFARDRKSLRQMAYLTAVLNDLEPARFCRQIENESGFNALAVSHAGAVGVAQIMPKTAENWKVDPTDPAQALDAAARMMARNWKTYQKQGYDSDTAYRMALAAYNAGPGAVSKYGKVPPFPETQHYVHVIMDHSSPRPVHKRHRP